MSVEMNGVSVGGCLFGIVIWAVCFETFLGEDGKYGRGDGGAG